MPRFPSRSFLPGLALLVLPLTLACARLQTGGEVCRVPGRDQLQQNVVFHSMEWAYDKVDFGFCRNQKCLVDVTATAECDVPDIRECVVRHIQAANGLVVKHASDATLKLSSVIDRVHYERDQPMYGADRESCEFKGSLAITETGPGSAKRVVKLYGFAQKAN